MTTHAMTPAQAELELSLLNAEAESISSGDIYAWLRDTGLPSEAAIRLKGLVDITAPEVTSLPALGLMNTLMAQTPARPMLSLTISIRQVGSAVNTRT